MKTVTCSMLTGSEMQFSCILSSSYMYIGMLLCFPFLCRQEPMKAEADQRPLQTSPDEKWAATLPNAWRHHVWSEKEDLKK